jgi:hypothetical protein
MPAASDGSEPGENQLSAFHGSERLRTRCRKESAKAGRRDAEESNDKKQERYVKLIGNALRSETRIPEVTTLVQAVEQLGERESDRAESAQYRDEQGRRLHRPGRRLGWR